MVFADCIVIFRVNLNTELQNLATNAQIKNSSSDNQLELKDEKHAFTASKQDYLVKGEFEVKQWVVHRVNIIISVFLKTILNTLVPFFDDTEVILLYMCDDLEISCDSANPTSYLGLLTQAEAAPTTLHPVKVTV